MRNLGWDFLGSKMGSAMGDEKDAFYVVRKGEIVGVYRSFSECQQQASSSVISHFTLTLFFYLFFSLKSTQKHHLIIC